ncbi:MAG: hypothetical protein LBG88_01535 [Christensenellaceae bacterium]|nr:hypothetical protein [Christensenellaceae bacterium]
MKKLTGRLVSLGCALATGGVAIWMFMVAGKTDKKVLSNSVEVSSLYVIGALALLIVSIGCLLGAIYGKKFAMKIMGKSWENAGKQAEALSDALDDRDRVTVTIKTKQED